MIEWQRAYGDLKKRYFVQSKERLDQVVTLIDQVQESDSSSEIVREISHHFHWLAGSGGIYGLPELTKLGKQAEHYCESALQSDKCAPSTELLLGFVASARNAFAVGEKSVQSDVDGLSTYVPETQVLDILLIDESASRTAKYVETLKERSMQVTVASSCKQGLAAITAKPFDGLLVSVPLSDGSGYDLVENFRTSSETQPAFLISNEPGFLDKVRAIHCGVDAFFEEPLVIK